MGQGRRGCAELEKRKTDLQGLETEEFPAEEATLYEVWKDGVEFDFLLYLRPEQHRAVIFGNGALDITDRRSWPFFHRSSWAPDIPVTSIYWSDPTCYEGEASLCWGYGIGERWYLREVVEILEIFLQKLEIPIGQTLFFGSSGGGFTAMMLACMMQGRATVFDPQVFVEKYYPNKVEKLKEAVLRSPGEGLIRERIGAPFFFQKEAYMPSIHLFQNIFFTPDGSSLRDRDTQLFPFLRAVESLRLLDSGRVLDVSLYSDLCGHTGFLDKEETIRIIMEDLDRGPVKSDLFYLLVRRAVCTIESKRAYRTGSNWAYYLYIDNVRAETRWYSKKTSVRFRIPEGDGSSTRTCRVRWFARYKELKRSQYADLIQIPPSRGT